MDTLPGTVYTVYGALLGRELTEHWLKVLARQAREVKTETPLVIAQAREDGMSWAQIGAVMDEHPAKVRSTYLRAIARGQVSA